ncbi:RGS domain-containing protein [Gaertneriomyces semiglobifer]|nr:RGS domain-containing protein [Gaertneriomyces semiglobifer]
MVVGRSNWSFESLWTSVTTLVNGPPTTADPVEDLSSPIASNTLAFTKQCFERVMTNPELYAEFRSFCKASHCHENLQFYEEIKDLEDLLLRELPGYIAPTTLCRFVHSKGHIPTPPPSPTLAAFPIFSPGPLLGTAPDTSKPVPNALLPHFLYFHACYLTANCPTEINLPSTIKQQISLKLERGGELRSDVFDRAADEIINLIYFDSFARYINQKKEVAPPPDTPYTAQPLQRSPSVASRKAGSATKKPKMPNPPPLPKRIPDLRQQIYRPRPTDLYSREPSKSMDIHIYRPELDDSRSDSGVSISSTKSFMSVMSVKSIKHKLAGAGRKLRRKVNLN